MFDRQCSQLQPEYIQSLDGPRLGRIMRMFHEMKGMPVRMGAVDRYRRAFYSMVLQGTADYPGLFVDISVGMLGMLGRARDSCVFTYSSLCSCSTGARLFPADLLKQIESCDVYPCQTLFGRCCLGASSEFTKGFHR